jgi:hypothetical protein
MDSGIRTFLNALFVLQIPVLIRDVNSNTLIDLSVINNQYGYFKLKSSSKVGQPFFYTGLNDSIFTTKIRKIDGFFTMNQTSGSDPLLCINKIDLCTNQQTDVVNCNSLTMVPRPNVVGGAPGFRFTIRDSTSNKYVAIDIEGNLKCIDDPNKACVFSLQVPIYSNDSTMAETSWIKTENKNILFSPSQQGDLYNKTIDFLKEYKTWFLNSNEIEKIQNNVKVFNYKYLSIGLGSLCLLLLIITIVFIVLYFVTRRRVINIERTCTEA